MAAPSFANEVKQMFRDKDHSAMTFAFDLWDYDDVKENADDILSRVRNGDMPCDGEEPRPTKEEIALLKTQIKDGVSRYLYEQTKRRPMVFPVVVEV